MTRLARTRGSRPGPEAAGTVTCVSAEVNSFETMFLTRMFTRYVPGDEGEEVLEAEQPVPDLLDLGAVELDGEGLLVLVDGGALRIGDEDVDLQGRVEAVSVPLEGELPGLDEVMDEGHSRRVPDDAGGKVAVDVVGRVLDADAVLVLVEVLGVGVLDLLPRRRGDLGLEKDLGGHRRGARYAMEVSPGIRDMEM